MLSVYLSVYLNLSVVYLSASVVLVRRVKWLRNVFSHSTCTEDWFYLTFQLSNFPGNLEHSDQRSNTSDSLTVYSELVSYKCDSSVL